MVVPRSRQMRLLQEAFKYHMKSIELHKRRDPIGVFTNVDDCDFELLSAYRWGRTPFGYPNRYENGEMILMHRSIMNPAPGLYIDHIDGNPLNNLRRNLRFCTHGQNQQNRSKMRAGNRLKGACLKRGRWESCINSDGKYIYLGIFSTEAEAHAAYCAAAKKYHGEFANFGTFTTLGLI